MNNKLIDYVSQIICFCQDRISGKGEDSFMYYIEDNATIIAAFDGCGGIGGRKYSEFDNKTGAYLASRAVSEATYRWFVDQKKDIIQKKYYADSLKRYIDAKLEEYVASKQKNTLLKGSMQKDFPTTLAMALIKKQGKNLVANILWSGDSRVYFLGEKGLLQLSKDDVKNEDAMSNIENSGVMYNVISASVPYKIREYVTKIPDKGFIFVSSDGCFDYLQSPMHFEHLILEAILSAKCFQEFQDELKNEIMHLTGDDSTFVGVFIGFSSHQEIQSYYYTRYLELKQNYIDPFNQDNKYQLWETYKKKYESIMETNIKNE